MSYYELTNFKKLLMQRYGIENIEGVKDPLAKMYLDFALSTVWRGEYIRNIVAQHAEIKGKRYLDVGCAYGGFLVAFENAGAADAVGIDINEQLLDYSRAVLADCDSKAQVYNKSILDKNDLSDLGKFDIITCNDVIEHIEEPKIGMENMASMLNDNGMIFFQIPNKFSAQFVKSDGHFQLFGITVLPKYLADKYYEKIHPGQKHDVYYKSLNYYLINLKKLGMQCNIINQPAEDKDKRLKEILDTFLGCENNIVLYSANLSSEIKDEVIKRVLRLSNIFKECHEKYQSIKHLDMVRAQELLDRLILTFGTDFWMVTAEKT